MAHPIWGSLLKTYESEHQKRGTRATHLVAFPLMALAVLLAFVKLRWGVTLFAVAWTVQYLGHALIEGNPQCVRGWRPLLVGGLWAAETWRGLLRRRNDRSLN